jgi:hypothetical protein
MRSGSEFRGLIYMIGVLSLTPIVGCGSDEPAVQVAGDPTATAMPEDASNRLLAGPPATEPSLAASGGQLLVVGGLQVAEDDAGRFLRAAEDALIVDVATGESQSIAAPGAERPILVRGAVGDSEGFVVIGQVCTEARRLDANGWECSPNTGVAYRLNLDGALDWTEIPLPEAAAGAHDSLVSFEPIIGSTPAGQAFAAVQSGPPSSEPLPVRLMVLDDAGWMQVAEVGGVRMRAACASTSAFYILAERPAESASAALVLLEVAADSASPIEVALPELNASFGGIAVQLACDRSGPYVTTAAPDLNVPMSTLRWRDGVWTPIGGDWSAELVHRMTSASAGVVVVSLGAAGAARYRARSIGADQLTSAPLPAEDAARLFVPDPVNDDFVAVGPIPRLRSPNDASAPERLSITRLDPQS